MKSVNMSFFSSKRSLLVLDAKRAEPQIPSAKNASTLHMQAAHFFSECRACICAVTVFLSNNLRKVLLALVIAFFIIQISTGALSVLRNKSQAPYKRNDVAVRVIHQSLEPLNYLWRLPASA
jgi:hypothetical protein